MTDKPVYYNHPLGMYRLDKSSFGLYTSILKEGDIQMVTGLTEDATRISTEFIHLPFHYGKDSSDIKTTIASTTEHVPL